MPDDRPTSREHSTKARSGWRKLVKYGVGLVLLAGVFWFVPVEGVWSVLQTSRPLPIIGALIAAFAMQWAVAERLRRICDAHGLGWSTLGVLQINLATRFYGFLPGGNVTGFLIRFYKLTGNRKRYADVAVALFYDRVAATVTLCGVGALFWLLEWPGDSWQALVAILAAMAVMIFGLLVLFARRPGPIVGLARRCASRLVGVRLNTVRQAVRASRALPRTRVVWVYTVSVVAHLIGVAGWYLIAQSMDIDVTFGTVGWVRSAMILATMIPVSAFGLGLREGAAMLLLSGYGISNEQSVAFSLLVFTVFFLAVGLVGGLTEAVRVLRHS
ncbi:MAG: lysylphosphatidylglycerol synthase transmembrane domain-containing protein [Phycisphaeraceae bacterium]